MSEFVESTKKIGRLTALSLLAIALVLAIFPASSYAEGVGIADDDESAATVSFLAGDITIEEVPALDFGEQDITSGLKKYKAINEDPSAIISDLRGTAEGWTLYASLSKFTLTEGGTETLQGAYITFEGSDVSGEEGAHGNDPVVPDSIKLESTDTQTEVFQAASGDGMGVWSNTWQEADIELVVAPGTARQGANSATITWSLQATP